MSAVYIYVIQIRALNFLPFQTIRYTKTFKKLHLIHWYYCKINHNQSACSEESTGANRRSPAVSAFSMVSLIRAAPCRACSSARRRPLILSTLSQLPFGILLPRSKTRACVSAPHACAPDPKCRALCARSIHISSLLFIVKTRRPRARALDSFLYIYACNPVRVPFCHRYSFINYRIVRKDDARHL